MFHSVLQELVGEEVRIVYRKNMATGTLMGITDGCAVLQDEQGEDWYLPINGITLVRVRNIRRGDA